MFPETGAGSLRTISGFSSKSISDCATILKNIAGHDARDPLSSRYPVGNFSRAIGKSVKGLKFGVLHGLLRRQNLGL